METNKKGMMCESCGGGGMHGGCCCGYSAYGDRHVVLRLILGIFILMVVFWMGVKIGEIKAMFGGYGRHGGYGEYGPVMMRSYSPNMMWDVRTGTTVKQEAVVPQTSSTE